MGYRLLMYGCMNMQVVKTAKRGIIPANTPFVSMLHF
jgi:hypothetical protein